MTYSFYFQKLYIKLIFFYCKMKCPGFVVFVILLKVKEVKYGTIVVILLFYLK